MKFIIYRKITVSQNSNPQSRQITVSNSIFFFSFFTTVLLTIDFYNNTVTRYKEVYDVVTNILLPIYDNRKFF